MSEPGTPAADSAAEADAARAPAPDPAPDPPRETAPETADPGPEPSWWHRSHPTFAGLMGFFSGVAYVIVVPGLYAALLGLLLSDEEAKRLFPLILVALVVPLVLLVPRKTRRFAQFMLLGVVSTAVVIGLTTVAVIWLMIKISG